VSQASGTDAPANGPHTAYPDDLHPPNAIQPALEEGVSGALCKWRDLRVHGRGLWAGEDHSDD